MPSQRWKPVRASSCREWRVCTVVYRCCTDKKENQILLIYKEIQSGAVAKSYVRKSFLIYEEMRKADSHIWLCKCAILNFLVSEENLIFFFISVECRAKCIRLAKSKWRSQPFRGPQFRVKFSESTLGKNSHKLNYHAKLFLRYNFNTICIEFGFPILPNNVSLPTSILILKKYSNLNKIDVISRKSLH